MHEIGQKNTKNSLAAGALPQTSLGDLRLPDPLKWPPSQIPGYGTACSILLPKPWPVNTTPEYGEVELRSIAQPFLVPYSGQLKADYREMKDSAGKTIPPTMRKFICAIATLPVSAAACERG